MAEKTITLIDLFSSAELAEIYKPDASLDRKAQILGTIAFMRKEVPVEERQDDDKARESFRVIPEGYLATLLKDNYPTLDEITDMLIGGLCDNQNNRPRKHFRNLAKQHLFPNGKMEAVYHVINGIVYDPGQFYKFFHMMLWSVIDSPLIHALGKPTDETTSEIVSANPIFQDMQVKFFDALMQKNQKYVTAARNMPFTALAEDGSFGVNFSEFFGKKESYFTDWAKLIFGTLTSHIGYFSNPQYGKLVQIYASRTKLTGPQLMDIGMEFGEQNPTGQTKDLRKQIISQTQVLRLLRYSYDSIFKSNMILEHSLTLSDKRIGELSGAIQRMSDEYDKLDEQLRKMGEDLVDMKLREEQAAKTRDQITLEIKAEMEVQYQGISSKLTTIQRELEEKKADLAHKVETLSKTRARLNGLESDNSTYARRVTQLERDVKVLSDRLASANGKTRFGYSSYVVNSMQDPRIMEALENAEQRLSENKMPVPPISTNSLDNSYRNLKKYCPNANDFYKIHGPNNTCIAYTLFNKMVFFVWANFHNKYDEEITELKRKG